MRINRRWALWAISAVVPWTASYAAQQTVNAPIKHVTVYANMARVVRSAMVAIPAGDQTVLIENLPTNSDPNSFRVEVPGETGVTMMNFRQEAKDYVESVRRDVSGATHQRDSCIRLRNLLNDHRTAFDAQKQLLTSYQDVARQALGQNIAEGALNTAQWEGAFRFVGQRMTEIGDSLRESDRRLAEVSNLISKCDNEIAHAYDQIRHVGRSVYVDLQAKAPSSCSLKVSYMMTGASWTPAYDARLSPDGKTVSVTAFALINQRTGEPWDSVELVLSTAAPSGTVGPGEYRPMTLGVIEPQLDLYKTITVSTKRDVIDKFTTSNQVSISNETINHQPAVSVDSLLKQVAGVRTTAGGEVFIRGSSAGEIGYVVDGVPIGDPLGGIGSAGANLRLTGGTDLSLLPNVPVTFKARRLETVNSGQEPVRTIIGQWDLDAKTKILARPRSLEGAFRIVTITNQDGAPLLGGSVALFTGNEYIGTSALNRLVPPAAEFELPFGRETRVTVERNQSSVTRDRDKNETKIDQTIRFTLKNHSAFASTIQLEEPLPIAQDSRIKVRLDSDKIAKPTIDHQGKAIWTITLAPGQSDSLAVPIHVSYPSSVRVSGL